MERTAIYRSGSGPGAAMRIWYELQLALAWQGANYMCGALRRHRGNSRMQRYLLYFYSVLVALGAITETESETNDD